MNILVDIILDSGTLLKSLRDFYHIANRISEDSRKRISEDGKYRTTEDRFYIGDIIDDFQVTENLPDIFYGVQQTDPVTLLLANGDNGIDDTWDEIIAAEEIRGKRVLIRREDLSIIESGKIIDYIIGDEVSLSIELRDDEIFDTLLPQQLVTAAEFTTTALDIGAPVPILPGYCKNVPLANIQNNLVDDHYDYLIGYGTVESLWIDHNNNRGVRRNGVLVAESEYTFYDGFQASPYPGYSFIRFIKEQMDFSGGFYMLSADVKGLKLDGVPTVGEVPAERNFANVIKALIENTTWGLGDSVNSASFAAAATALSTTYWMCDGAITKQVKARDVLDQLLFSARSSLKRNSDGEWEITVNGTQSSTVSFGENDGYYDNCEIESVGITPSSSAIKKAIVHYDMKETPYKASDIAFSSQAIIGQKEITLDVNTMFGADQTFELPFVIEDVTAKKILSYIYGRAKYADKKVTFKADSDAKNLYCGNVVTITSTLRNLSVIEHKVISISKRLTEYLLECERYDSRIFDDQSITDPTAWSGSPSTHGLRIIKSGTVGGWTVDENTLADGDKIVLDATNKKIYINDGVFGNQGVQIDYNAGIPRFHVGDGSTKFFKFDGTNFILNLTNLVISSSNQTIKLGTGNDIISLDAADSIYRLAIGHITYGSAPFRVTKAGILTCTGANIRGTLNADDLIAGTLSMNRLGANTITASKIKGSNFGTLTIASGKIVFNTTDALEIGGSGNVKILNGGDIICIKGAGSSNFIYFKSSGGSTISSIGVGFNSLHINSDTVVWGNLRADSDSSRTLGTAFNCWLNIYGDAGVTACSMRKYKTNIQPESLGLNFINALQPVSFNWNKKKGKNLEGVYRGIIIEDIESALEKIDYKDKFAGINIEKSKSGETWKGLRYDQLFSPIIKAIQELDIKIENMKTH